MIYKYLYYKSLANDGNNEERWQKKNTTTTSTIWSSTVLYDEKEKYAIQTETYRTGVSRMFWHSQ